MISASGVSKNYRDFAALDEPANEFVMGFIGEVNRLGHELVRPHDLEIVAAPNSSTREAQIDRVVHLGFEVRVELTLGEGDRIWVQTTRDRAQELELEPGQIVFLRKDAARSFASSPAAADS